MSNPENEKRSQISESFHPGEQPDPMKTAINPPPPMYGESPSMPNQYQAYAGPPGAVPMQPYGGPPGAVPMQPYGGPPGAIPMQPQQPIFITNVQPLSEPDYLGYSIFTLLCCCFPLGIAALVYSIMTQGANHRGDTMSAKKYSRLTLTLNHTALGLGIASIVLGIIWVIVVNVLTYKAVQQSHFGNYNP